MTFDEIVALVEESFDDVSVTIAGPENGAPEAAWGDAFFMYTPADGTPAPKMPFATIVTQDYEGFDTASDLDRDGIFRLNLHVGRDQITETLGEGWDDQDTDFTAIDAWMPHPVYARQGWMSIINPSDESTETVERLIRFAHGRQAARRRA